MKLCYTISALKTTDGLMCIFTAWLCGRRSDESSTSAESGSERRLLFARHLSRLFTPHDVCWRWPWRHCWRHCWPTTSGAIEHHRVGVSRPEHCPLYLVSAWSVSVIVQSNQLPSSFRQPHSVHCPPGSPHPAHITSSQSPSSLSSPITASTFHSRLKTHLFHKSFPP